MERQYWEGHDGWLQMLSPHTVSRGFLDPSVGMRVTLKADPGATNCPIAQTVMMKDMIITREIVRRLPSRT